MSITLPAHRHRLVRLVLARLTLVPILSVQLELIHPSVQLVLTRKTLIPLLLVVELRPSRVLLSPPRQPPPLPVPTAYPIMALLPRAAADPLLVTEVILGQQPPKWFRNLLP